MTELIPFNIAEAIFEPFWDPRLSGLAQWTLESGEAHGLVVAQNWCWVALNWARRPADGLILRMTRQFNLDLRLPGENAPSYDHLIASINLPEGAHLRLLADTDVGRLVFETPPSNGKKGEPVFPLGGASYLEALTLEVYTARQGLAAGWLNWLGVQNRALLDRYLAQYRRFSAQWEGYLKPESCQPRFEPAFGLLISAEELTAFRQEHQAALERQGATPYTLAAEAASRLIPEAMIHDFVNFWNDTRYSRQRDEGRWLLRYGPEAALAGLLLQDAGLLRLAARYALAIAFCDVWDDGMICAFPGSTFDHRCFVQSLCTYETALILDLAGECFTDLGRDYILRRIGEHGIGNINQIVWAYEYIFHNNQLAWFTPGRMLGYLLLERFWPRVRPYTELALQDLVESLEDTVLPDGGYVEGPSYFRCVARDGGLALYHYARARGKDLAHIVPPAMLRTAPFAAALASTDDQADAIPICDGHAEMELEALAMMAAALPESAWVNMYRKALARQGGFPSTVLAWQLNRQIPAAGPDLPAFVYLAEMGVMASARRLGGAQVKLFLMGNRAGAGHTHEDKGSFVLEFAGETFALDPGTCDYSHPDADLLKNCQRHNMLTPSGLAERPHPQCPLEVDVKPSGAGDAQRFTARLDATPGWEPYYRRWVRSWESPDPATLIIRDEYELAQGSGVTFYWNTRLPVEVGGETVTLNGRRGRAVIRIPDGCTVSVEELSIAGGDFQRQIIFQRAGVAGQLEVQVALTFQPE